MRSGCQLLCDLKLPNIYEGMIDASVNTYWKLKLVFLEKCLQVLGRQYFEMESLHFFGAWTRQATIELMAVVYELTKRTHEILFADWAQ